MKNGTKLILIAMLGLALSTPTVVWAKKDGHDCKKCAAKVCPLTKKDCDKKKCDKCEKDKENSVKEKFFYKAELFLKHADDLGLSEDQVKKIKELKLSTKKAYVIKKAEIEVASMDFKAGLYGTIDVNDMNRIIDSKYDLKKEKSKLLVKAYADLKEILSDQQMKKLKELKEEKHKE